MHAPRRHYISSFIGMCKFVLVSRHSAGPPFARGPIGSNQSNRLSAGSGVTRGPIKGFMQPSLGFRSSKISYIHSNNLSLF